MTKVEHESILRILKARKPPIDSQERNVWKNLIQWHETVLDDLKTMSMYDEWIDSGRYSNVA